MLRRRSNTVAAAASALFFSGLFRGANGKIWRCQGERNYGNQEAADFAKCNNGYLSHASITGHYAPSTDCRSDPDDFFEETQCVCYTFYSGCLCENDWFEDCNASESFSIIFYLQNYICMLCFGASAYFSLVQIGHMMRAREKYGNQAQKMHNDTRLSTDCCSAWKLVLLHATEQVRQTFLNLAEALCVHDQSALDNTCCYLESKQQHINRTMSLKFAVLDNAFIFSFCMALWTLNPYDLIFDTGDWWWLFFYLGIPHIMWAYEAILVQWLKVNSQAEGGAMFQQETHREKVWKAIRFVPKAMIFCMGFIAALFENYLKKCSGIDDWCLEGDSETVKKKLGTDRCSCADQYLISVGPINLTRTTWPFMVWGLFVGAHVLAYFVLFATSGHNLSKQLDAQNGGETAVQPKSSGKKMQSKESRNIRHFIRILTALFLSVSVVFVVFVVYPDVNMRSHICFWVIWKIILLVTLFFMYRCVRTPESRASHWLSTMFCCGEDTRDSVVMTVDPIVDRMTTRFIDLKTRISRSGSSAPMSSAEESNSGIVLEGTPSIDSDDEDEVERRNGRWGASQDGAVTSPFGHAEDGDVAGEQSVELHEIPLKDGKPATLGRSNSKRTDYQV